MYKLNKERLKSLLLAALLVVGIFQMGILWNDIDTGFPFSHLAGGAGANTDAGSAGAGAIAGVPPLREQPALADAAAVVFNPYRITVCDGGQRTQRTQRAHYPVPRGGEVFSSVTARCLTFFEDMTAVAPEPDEIPVTQWGSLVSERGILVEFKTAISLDIIKWLTDRQNSVPGAPTEARKLLILPEDNAGRQTVCLYVLTSDRIVRLFSQSVSSYDIQRLIGAATNGVNTSGMAAEAVMPAGVTPAGGAVANGASATGAAAGSTAATGLTATAGLRYQTISEVGGGRFPMFAPDVFCVVDGPKTEEFKRIKYTAPTDIRDKAELENIILGSAIYSYNRSLDYNDTLVFKNMTSVYRLYKNGFMEYNYIPLTQPAEKGSLTGALGNAVAYVLNIERQLLGGAELILSGVYQDESGLTYRFTFDYMFGDYPIHFNYAQTAADTTTVYRNAITVQANAGRTVSCRWALVDLFFTTQAEKMQVYFDRIEVGQELTRMAVSDIAIAYTVDLNAGVDSAYEWPVWAVTTPDGGTELVPLISDQ